MRREPVGDDRLAVLVAESIMKELVLAGFRNIRGFDFDAGVELSIAEQRIRILKREVHWPRSEIVRQAALAVNESEIVVFISIDAGRKKPDKCSDARGV